MDADLHPDRKRAIRTLAPQLNPGDNLVFLGATKTWKQLGAWRIRSATGSLERPNTLPRPAELLLVFDARLTPSDDLIAVLAEGIADRHVGAVAPRSNYEADDPSAAAPYDPSDIAAKRAYLREIGAQRPHHYARTATLTTPCVLLRRRGELAKAPLDQLASAQGLQEAFAHFGQLNNTLLVAQHAYVDCPRALQQHGSLSISACLIVKDEAHQLATCLRAASALADEVVIYDTGSTDDTIAVARELGARVIEGYWDDDFGRARNTALAHCHGEWILWVDADEELRCDAPADLRALLAVTPDDVDAYLVSVDNLQGTDASTVFTHPAARLFRRANAQWEGRIHEQVVRRANKRPVRVRQQQLVRITHRGYLQHAMRARNKSERNLRVAFGDLSADSALDMGTRTLSLARSYMLAGRYEEGRELCSRAVELARDPSTLRLALRTLGDALLFLRRFNEVLDVAEQLKRHAHRPLYAYILEGKARLGRREPGLALAAFDRLSLGQDDDGFEYRPSMVAVQRAEALQALERYDEACDVLLDMIRTSDGMDDHVGVLLSLLRLARRDLAEAYDAIRAERRLAFLPQIVQLERSFADDVLESWHHRDPSSLPLLAAAAQIAYDLPLERKLVWSARLRQAGFWAPCPLVAATTDGRLSASSRAIAGAVAFQSFADPRARVGYRAALRTISSEERSLLGEQIPAISPALSQDLATIPALVRPERALQRCDAVRSLLVVSAGVTNFAVLSFAMRAAISGHQVTLLQPDCGAVRQLLQDFPITVRGWTDAPEPGSPAALRAAALMYAARRYQVVALGSDLSDAVDRFRTLFPVSTVLVLDEQREAEHLDVPSLFGVAAAVPIEARGGICVVADWENPDAAAQEAAARRIHDLLGTMVESEPLTLLNGSLSGSARQHFPGALLPDPAVNPLPWLSSAKVVLITGVRDTSMWERLADASGTPAVIDNADSEIERSARHLREAIANQAIAGRTPHTKQTPVPTRRTDVATPTGADPLAQIPRDSAPCTHHSGGDQKVHLKGSVYSLDSLAQVNRELARQLHRHLGDRLEITTPEPLTSGIGRMPRLSTVQVNHARCVPPGGSVEIRHQWPPDFSPSSADHLVVIQPWEFGVFPAEWTGAIRDVVDELWVPTTWVRDCAIRSGIDSDKVVVVPNGVDTERFTPHGSRYPLKTKKSTRFLYVGGCIARKGVDALLETYLTTFSRDDDVCLVVKPHSSKTVYRDSNLDEDIRRAAASSGPEIEVIDADLDPDDIAALYRSCTAFVQPYRGEGFGLPIAEAMASGLPVVTTNGGACLDYCDESAGWLIDSRAVPTAVPSLTPAAGAWWWLEPSRERLAAAMREVAADHDAARERGARGRSRIVESFTWGHAAEIAATRLELLIGAPQLQQVELAAKGVSG